MTNFGNLCCITYLQPAGPGRGGTDVIPCTHRTADSQHEGPLRLGTTVVEEGRLSRRSVEGLDSLLPQVVSPEFDAGDVLLFDSWVLHRADSNATATTVIGLVNVYCRPDCRPLEPSIKSVHVAASTKLWPAGPAVLRDGVPVPPPPQEILTTGATAASVGGGGSKL